MTIKQQLIWVGLLLPLAACSAPAQQTAERLTTNLRDNFYETTQRLEKIITEKPQKPQPKSVAASYCYNVYQDILCYRAPMPGWENRLAGYQGTNAQPPTPAVMQPMPVQVAPVEKVATTRVASAKPIYAKMPAPKSKVTANSGAMGGAPDASQEQLPDPAMSPQL